MRAETRSALLRRVFLCSAPLLAWVACTVEPVSLTLPPDPPPKGSAAACTGAPATLARLSGIVPDVMLADEYSLYVIASPGADSSAAQSVWRVPKDGSSPQRLLTSEASITSFGAQSDFTGSQVTFWTSADPSEVDGAATGSVRSIGPVATDAPVVLASHRPSPGALYLLDDDIYWVEQAIDPSGQPVAAIVRMPQSGGPIAQVQALGAGHIPRRLRAYRESVSEPDGSFATIESLFWSTWNGEPGSENEAEIVDCRLPGPCAPRTRITGPDAGGAGALNLDLTSSLAICFSGPQGIMDVAVTPDGGLAAPQLVAPTDGFVDGIETDLRDVYFVDRASQRLQALTRSGDAEAPRTIVSAIAPGAAFRVDAACVYWIDASAGSILMVKK